MVALSSPVRFAVLMFRREKREYKAADSSPRAMPSRYRTSRLKTSSTPAMAMKLIRISRQDTRFRLISGSSRAVKKQEVAMHATPTDTFDVWMLAKNATQCKARNAPHPAIRQKAGQETLCSRRSSASAPASTGTLIIMRYHTSGSPPREIILPRIPVHPARNTAVWRMTSVFVSRFFILQR